MRKIVVSKDDLPREKLANPFSKDTLHNRLVDMGAIDLRDNYNEIDHGNGYSTIVPINENKKIK